MQTIVNHALGEELRVPKNQRRQMRQKSVDRVVGTANSTRKERRMKCRIVSRTLADSATTTVCVRAEPEDNQDGEALVAPVVDAANSNITARL